MTFDADFCAELTGDVIGTCYFEFVYTTVTAGLSTASSDAEIKAALASKEFVRAEECQLNADDDCDPAEFDTTYAQSTCPDCVSTVKCQFCTIGIVIEVQNVIASVPPTPSPTASPTRDAPYTYRNTDADKIATLVGAVLTAGLFGLAALKVLKWKREKELEKLRAKSGNGGYGRLDDFGRLPPRKMQAARPPGNTPPLRSSTRSDVTALF